MTVLMPTCAEVTALLTDYEEGALDPLHWLGLRLHLGLCPPCRKFLATFHAPLALLRTAWAEAPAPQAEQALRSALGAIRAGRLPLGPQHHPDAQDWACLDHQTGDPCLRLLLGLHLGQCAACSADHPSAQALRLEGDPILALHPHLPAEAQWRWIRHGLGGSEIAWIVAEAHTGASLSLARLPGGRTMPLHGHGGIEQTMVLTGALQDGPAHLQPGDWSCHGQAEQHSPTADPGADCWCLTRLEGGVRFLGWRGLLGRVG